MGEFLESFDCSLTDNQMLSASINVAHADKRPVAVLVGAHGDFLSLLINVNAKLFNGRNLRFTLFVTILRERLVLNRNRLDFF